MKLKKPYFYFALLIAICYNNLYVQAQSCRISKMITPEETEYFFQYDTSCRLQTITSSMENRLDSFFYYQDSIVIITNLNNKRDSRTVYTLNKSGRVTHQKFLPISYEGWIENIDYTYKDGHLITIVRAVRLTTEPPEKTTISKEVFTWQNGNPIKITNYEEGKPNGSEELGYSNKKYRVGDFNSTEFIMTGLQILKPTNLLKNMIGPISLYLSYEFDSLGNIISMTEKEENDIRVTKYEYECK